MNQPAARAFSVKLAVIASVSAAAWQFGIRPLRTDLAEKQASLAAIRSEVDGGLTRVSQQPRTPDAVIAELKAQADELRDAWDVAADASVLYEQFDAIAHRHGITIERLEPLHASDRTAPTQSEEDTPSVTELAYAIELSGEYDSLTRFILAVQTETGLMRVESVRIAPAGTPAHRTRARASLRTTHFRVEGGLQAFAALSAPRGGS